jgi:hypothetical protein
MTLQQIHLAIQLFLNPEKLDYIVPQEAFFIFIRYIAILNTIDIILHIATGMDFENGA